MKKIQNWLLLCLMDTLYHAAEMTLKVYQFFNAARRAVMERIK